MRRVLAGPWVGEFGHELFRWQGRLRVLAKSVGEMYVLCRPGHEVIYQDFAFVNTLPFGGAQGHLMRGLKTIPAQTELCGYDPCWSEDRLRKDRFYEQAYVRYGTRGDHRYDVVVHARARNHRAQHNWPADRWDDLTRRLSDQGLRIGLIGDRRSSCELAGGEDLRGVALSELADVLANSSVIVGTSSGPLHFASLCGCPQVILTGEENRRRYEKDWNPFGVNTSIVPGGWRPGVDAVRACVNDLLSARKMYESSAV